MPSSELIEAFLNGGNVKDCQAAKESALHELDILILETAIINESAGELLQALLECSEDSLLEVPELNLVAH